MQKPVKEQNMWILDTNLWTNMWRMVMFVQSENNDADICRCIHKECK